MVMRTSASSLVIQPRSQATRIAIRPKPVPLIAYLIKQCTQSNGLVLDGFLGSASTLIACEEINRSCFGVEIEPKFVDVAVKRYVHYRNSQTEDVYLMRDGQRMSFEEAMAEMQESANGE